MRKNMLFIAYIIFASITTVLFYTYLVDFIMFIFQEFYVDYKTTQISVMPMNGNYLLYQANFILMFVLLLTPGTALLIRNHSKNIQSNIMLFLWLIFAILLVSIPLFIGYYLYYTYYLIPLQGNEFSLLQLPLKSLGITIFTVILLGTYIYKKRTTN